MDGTENTLVIFQNPESLTDIVVLNLIWLDAHP